MRKQRSRGKVALASAGLLLAGFIPADPSTGASTTDDKQVTQGKGDPSHHDGRNHKGPKTKVVAEGFAGPLSFCVEKCKRVFVGQAFSGSVTLLRPGKSPTDVAVSHRYGRGGGFHAL